ncbi:hypothetical protein [Donghicola sp. XS_ASV15]|uniref:hypothetical protein n=1 Tax=Donghicola sp. XS_ASV15 TaxID=3241295 RepID=UPI003515909B
MNTGTKALAFALLAAGCSSTNHEEKAVMGYYSPPWQSGLKEIRPYPFQNSICKEIGYNLVSRDFYDDSKLLVGCPRTEQDAIADRIAEGGVEVGYVHHWTLLHMPKR